MTTKAKNIDGGPLAIARDFISKQHTRDGLRTLQHWHGDFYAFNTNTYHNLADEELTAEMWRFVELNDAPTAHKINDALAALAALAQVYNVDALPQWLPDALHTPEPSSVIAFQNGLLDVSAYVKDGVNRLLPSTPSWFSVNVLPCNYVADADCPRWLTFLDDVLSEDRELLTMLSEWFGYCLTSDTSQQKALLMIGPQRSGKGTIIRALGRMVGADNCASPSLSALGERFGLSSLLGKTNALCPDAHLGRNADSIRVLETLKSIIGEDAQCIDRKHKEALASVRLQARFTLAVNELPSLPDASAAMRSRLLLLPFLKSYEGREDYTLEVRLRPETPGILLWALDGLRRLRRQGRFTIPAVSADLLRQFARLSSPVLAFVQDCCQIDPNLWIESTALWASWRTWCEKTNTHVGTRESFGNHLRAAVPSIRRVQRTLDDVGRRWGYEGIGSASGVLDEEEAPWIPVKTSLHRLRWCRTPPFLTQ